MIRHVIIKNCLDVYVVKNVKIYPKVVLEIDFKLSVACFCVQYKSRNWVRT